MGNPSGLGKLSWIGPQMKCGCSPVCTHVHRNRVPSAAPALGTHSYHSVLTCTSRAVRVNARKEWYGWTKGRIRKGETTEPHEPMHMRGQVVAHWQLCLSRLLPATVAGHSIACAVCGVAPSLLHPLAEL